MTLRELLARLSGRDRIERSREDLLATQEDMDSERIRRLRVLEESSRATAANLRAAEMWEAALLEKERADAITEQRRRLERERKARQDEAERLRIAQIEHDYGISNGTPNGTSNGTPGRGT